MRRRSFLMLSAQATAAVAVAPAQATGNLPLSVVPAGEDRFRQPHNMGITINNFKVSGADTAGALFVMEQTLHSKGGPPSHLHPHQDEWLYAIDGEFRVQIGDQICTLHPGDSVLGPRNIPHTWAFVGSGKGKLLVTFAPAGKMEAFFTHIASSHSMPPQDAALFSAYDMQLLGPPLKVS